MTLQVICPHCGHTVSSGDFCEACGKALPTSMPGVPRLVTGASLASTPVGQQIQSVELQKSCKKAAGALLAVAVIQAIVGTITLAAMGDQVTEDEKPLVMAFIYGVAAVFFALFFWARRQPLPAAIVGLALFVTLHLVDAIVDPTSLARGWLMKIIIVVVLVRAIQAGLQHRKLTQETRGRLG